MLRRLSLLAVLLVIVLFAGAGRITDPAAAQTPGSTPQRLSGHVLGVLGKSTKLASAANAGSLPVSLTVVLNRTDEADFRAFLANIQNPSSPNFQRFLSQADLTARFGPSQQAYDTTLKYLEQQGFTLVEGSANRLTLTVSGTRAKAEQAFSVHINDYQLGSRTFYANDTDPALSATVAPFVQAIVGLSNLVQPEPEIAHATPETAPRDAPAPNPMALATAYNFGGVHYAAGAGAGETIGLLEFDNYFDNDVTSWLGFVGLPTTLLGNLTRRPVDGGTTPGGVNSGEGEVMLDIETALGMAQGASIKVYDAAATRSSFEDQFNAMIGDNVEVISSSWEACEWQVSGAEAESVDSILAGGEASGISIFESSGDHGANCNEKGSESPPWPGDDPNALSVGGTNLQVESTGAYQSEGWWDSGSDAGGQGGYGLSCCLNTPTGTAYWPAPNYQSSFPSATTRSTPDVSADADPRTGIEVCEADAGGCPMKNANGQILLSGGTSMSTPEWAAGLALINQGLGHRLGIADTLLYAQATSNGFHSPSGMQGSVSGATNDFAHLGLGSFNLSSLYTALGGKPAKPVSAANSALTATRSNVPADGNATAMVIAVLRDTNGNPVSGTSVSLAANSGSNSTITTLSGTTDTSGQARFSVKDSTLETVTYTATDSNDGITVSQTAQVQFTPPSEAVSPSLSTVVANPTSVAADGSTTSTVTVTLKDMTSNPVSGRSVLLAGNSGSHSTISAAAAPSDGSGVVTFTLKDSSQETVVYTATDATDGIVITPTASVTFTFSSSSSGNGVSIQPPASQVAPGRSVTVTAQVTAQPPGLSSWEVTLTYDPTVLTPTNCVGYGNTPCNVNASATSIVFDGLAPTAIVGSQTLATLTFTAIGAGGSSSALTPAINSFGDGTGNPLPDPVATGGTVTITGPAVSPTLSTVSASPTSVAADGSTSSTVTVTLKDTNGSPVSGKTVALAGSNATSSMITTLRGTTDSQGQATFSVQDGTPETVTYTATDTSDSIVLTPAASVQFTQLTQTVSPTFSTVVANPTSVPDDGTTQATFTVTLKDSGGKLVNDKTVSLSPSAGAHATLSPASATTVSGVASFAVSDATAESVTYTAADTSDTPTITLAQAVTVSFSAVAVSSTAAPADGTTPISVTVTVTNAGDSASRMARTPAAGATVTLTAAAGSHAMITPSSATTNNQGQAQFAVTDASTQAVLLMAMANGTPLPQAPTVIFGALPRGDVNGSGTTDATDALCVLRIVAALPGTLACPKPPPGNPDVNLDGHLDATDALCILRHVADLPGTLACPAFGASVASRAAEAAPAAEAAAASTVTAGLSLSTNAVSVARGQQATVDLKSEATARLGSWTVDVSYDAQAVKVVSCQAAGGGLCNLSYAAGVVRVTGASAGGLRGSQSLATLSFAGLSHGRSESALGVTAITLADPAGAPLSSGGTSTSGTGRGTGAGRGRSRQSWPSGRAAAAPARRALGLFLTTLPPSAKPPAGMIPS